MNTYAITRNGETVNTYRDKVSAEWACIRYNEGCRICGDYSEPYKVIKLGGN